MSLVPHPSDRRVMRFRDDLALSCTVEEVEEALQRACRTCPACECSRCPVSAIAGDFRRYVLGIESPDAEAAAHKAAAPRQLNPAAAGSGRGRPGGLHPGPDESPAASQGTRRDPAPPNFVYAELKEVG